MEKSLKYHDLRDFLMVLETAGELKKVIVPVSPYLEMTEVCDRLLRRGGPAVLFQKPVGHRSEERRVGKECA